MRWPVPAVKRSMFYARFAVSHTGLNPQKTPTNFLPQFQAAAQKDANFKFNLALAP